MEVFHPPPGLSGAQRGSGCGSASGALLQLSGFPAAAASETVLRLRSDSKASEVKAPKSPDKNIPNVEMLVTIAQKSLGLITKSS